MLAALIINEHEWNALDNEVKKVKMSYFPNMNDDDVELHADNLVTGKEIFASMPRENRGQLYKETLNMLSSKDATIVASVIRKAKLTKPLDIELWGYRLLFERICFVLEKKNKQLLTSGSASEYGLLLIDSVEKKFDRRTRSKLLCLMRGGTMYVQNAHLISDPVFVSSEYRNMSQLADLIAWTIRRYLRGTAGWKDALAQELFPFIEPRLDRDDEGNWQGAGLKIFP